MPESSQDESEEERELQSLLGKFFATFSGEDFDPERIASWGAQQPGFEELSKHGLDEIRRALDAMVDKGSLREMTTRAGNRHYRSELQSLLGKFLTTQKRAFSPGFIAHKGAQQPGFEELSKHGVDEIARALEAMVDKGLLKREEGRGGAQYKALSDEG